VNAEKKTRQPRAPKAPATESTVSPKAMMKAIREEGFKAGVEKTEKKVAKLEARIAKLEEQLVKAKAPKPIKPVVDKSAKLVERLEKRTEDLTTTVKLLTSANRSKASQVKGLQKALKVALKPAKAPKPVNTEALVKAALKAHRSEILAALKGVL